MSCLKIHMANSCSDYGSGGITGKFLVQISQLFANYRNHCSYLLWVFRDTSLGISQLFSSTTVTAVVSQLLELRNWGGNVSKQLAQGCYPME